ncbi:MAG: hypothetical protein GEV05_20785 [Betaproteobacteria bacterium]|nr:hypothetical protein [Betaproteobacteria bacterium]
MMPACARYAAFLKLERLGLRRLSLSLATEYMSDRIGTRALRIGITLSITAGIAYVFCAAAWAMWHEQALDFLNGLFHGLDFRRILLAESEWGLWMFLYPLAVVSVAGFIVGAIHEVVKDLLDKIFR